MSKDPAVLFYASDFIAGTILMTHEQRGKYILLLCLQHEQGHLSENDMLTVCEGYDEKIFSKFELDENGLYFNPRMDEEQSKRKRYTSNRIKNLKQHHYSHMDSHMASHMDSHMDSHMASHMASHMENENENINISINKDINNISTIEDNIGEIDKIDKEIDKIDKEIDKIDKASLSELFDIFWKAYPRKVAKVQAKKSWDKLKPSRELLEVMLSAIDRQKQTHDWIKDGGQYVPHPSTYLNQRRWEDEIEIPVQPRASPAQAPKQQAPKPQEQVKWSNYDADVAFQRAVSRSYGEPVPSGVGRSPPKTDDFTEGADASFLAALKRTYG